MLREGKTGDWIGTFQGHKGAVWSCVLNDTAVLAATGAADYTARVWDALTGDEKYSFQHEHIVRSVQFAHEGPQLLTGGQEKILRIYDLEKPESSPVMIPGCTALIRNVAWANHDTALLTTQLDCPGVQVWDVRSQQLVHTLPTNDPVLSIEVSFDGHYLTTADNKAVTIWSLDNLSCLKQFALPYTVGSASFCPERSRFVAGGSGQDAWVRLHDFGTGAELECNKGHHGPVHTIKFAPTGELYASGSEDGTIRIWPTDCMEEGLNGAG